MRRDSTKLVESTAKAAFRLEELEKVELFMVPVTNTVAFVFAVHGPAKI
jgi:hypothetical protein